MKLMLTKRSIRSLLGLGVFLIATANVRQNIFNRGVAMKMKAVK